MAFPQIPGGLDVIGRPNGRLMIAAASALLPEEDFLGSTLYLDFKPAGMQLYFLHPETEEREGRTVMLRQNDRYDPSLALRLEAQKFVDVMLVQALRFDAIQNFMAICRLYR